MRLWHYALLPSLPDAQFKGQLRELVAIMHNWRDNGATNHLLINRVMEYGKDELFAYWCIYRLEYAHRYGKFLEKYHKEFLDFSESKNCVQSKPFDGWHDKEYLRVCMANLYEKHRFGLGKSRIGENEWNNLLREYKEITMENYSV